MTIKPVTRPLLPQYSNTFSMPVNAQVLTVTRDKDVIQITTLESPELSHVNRTFITLNDGDPSREENIEYVGTVQRPRGARGSDQLSHVFEKLT